MLHGDATLAVGGQGSMKDQYPVKLRGFYVRVPVGIHNSKGVNILLREKKH